MSYLIIGSQFIVSLSILILLHELGHFAPAKWFKTRVEKFYLFFDPWFSVWKTQKGETEYGIGWLPLGGYVKISGMVDESMDTEALKLPPQPWEFRSKPAWQRLIIMLGGVTVNFILGFLLLGIITFVWGKELMPNNNATYGIACDSTALKMGLRDGDKILAFDTTTYKYFDPGKARIEIIINDAKTIKVLRDGQEVVLNVPVGYSNELAKKEVGFFDIRMPFVVHEVVKGQAAEKAGLLAGDSLVAINNDSLRYFHEYSRAFKTNKQQAVKLTVSRNGQLVDLSVTPNENGKIGVAPKAPSHYFKTTQEYYGFGTSMWMGVKRGYDFVKMQISAFGRIFQGKINATDSVGGFGSIMSIFPDQWGWLSFLTITASLSLMLGFFNLLPIPALDGGHVMFLLWEVITGKKPSDKFMENAQMVGFVLLISLMLFANGNDIYKAFFK